MTLALAAQNGSMHFKHKARWYLESNGTIDGWAQGAVIN
jgi:hypothetical protein